MTERSQHLPDERATRPELRALVSERLRLVYVPVPKAACSSIKWALASAEGDVERRLASSAYPSSTPRAAIHDPSVHGLRSASEYPAGSWARWIADPEWTVFTVARDPYRRLVSAWFNRIVVNAPSARTGGLAGSFDVYRSDGSLDLAESFRQFCRGLAGDHADLLGDGHFRSQFDIVRPDVVQYDRIVHLEEVEEFLGELRRSSSARAGLTLPRDNESLRLTPDDVYDDDTAAMTDRIYRLDFETFGYATRSFPGSRHRVLEPDAVALLHDLRTRHDRILELSDLAKRRRGVRYGVSEIRVAIRQRIGGRRPRTR